MTAESVGGSSPRYQLARTRELARRVRREQRATWFPLLVFSIVTFLAIPVTRTGHAAGIVCRSADTSRPLALRVCVAHNSAAYVYWPIALIAAYGLIAGFYVYRSRAHGLGTRVRPYVVAGIVLAIAVTAASIWASHRVLVGQYDVLGWHLQGPDAYRIIGPACAIGLALLVLAASERSPALLAVSLAYLAIAVGGIDFGWTISPPSAWGFAPHLVIEGSLLLIAAAGFAVAQRPARHADATQR
jgi:hypothetical protein